MNIVERSVHGVVRELVRRERIELAGSASAEALAQELLRQIASAPGFAQVGSYLSKLMLRSEMVEELYADDLEIIEILNELGP